MRQSIGSAIGNVARNGLASCLFLAALTLSLSGNAQTGAAISGQWVTPTGQPAANARLTVCPYTAIGIPCFPQATIYSAPSLDPSTLLTQPYAANQYGNATVWVLPGTYLVQVAVNQTVTYSYAWTVTSGTSTGSIAGTGAPSLACATINAGQIYTDTAANKIYTCNGSTWSILGGLPLTGGTLTGPLNLPTLESQLFADQYQSPAGSGNNGIANSLTACTGLTYPCLIQAPASYSVTEAAPFGGAANNFYTPGNTTSGPKSSDPSAAFLDMRYGVPQWQFNQSTAVSNRLFASPSFTMYNATGPGAGLYSHFGNALTINSAAFTGGRNQNQTYGDKTNFGTMSTTSMKYTTAQGGGDFAQAVWCLGNGDCVGHTLDTFGFGNLNAQGDEGNESMRFQAIEGGQVFGAKIQSLSVASTGATTITPVNDATLLWNGYQGEDRMVIDLSKNYNTGYLSALGTIGNDAFATCSDSGTGCDWDGTYGVSTQTTTTATISNGVSTTTTFPQSNTNVAVTSSTGFLAGHIACIYGDYNYECEKITVVPDSTHITFALIRLPHPSGAYVTTGGMAGFGMELEADRVAPGAMNGRAINPDDGLSSIVRNVIPIMFNTTGNHAALFQGLGMPGVQWVPTSTAYKAMGSCTNGSTCSASATVVGGAVTGCTVSGGSGFTSTLYPPQLVISGITSTTAPVLYVSGVSGGALTTCAVANAGTGISGTITVTVTPSNPYDIYPAAKATSVFNAAAGKVDGTLYTDPLVGTWGVNDLIEQPHWFVQHYASSHNVVGQYIPSMGNAASGGFGLTLTGLPGTNDAAISIQNFADPTLYQGYVAPTPYVVGRGQSYAPYGVSLQGPFSMGLNMTQPPMISPPAMSGAVGVRCGTIGCAGWTNYYNMLFAQGNGGYDSVQYRPSDRNWNFVGSKFNFPTATINAAAVYGSASISPVCFNGTNGALTTTGCTTGTGSYYHIDQAANTDTITLGTYQGAIRAVHNSTVSGWTFFTGDGTDTTVVPYQFFAHPSGFLGMRQCASQVGASTDPTGCNFINAFYANATNVAAGYYAQFSQDNFTSVNNYFLPDLAGANDRFVMASLTQTLTNKTLDGVTPTTMSYVDPTSSIQTQLNGKMGTGAVATAAQLSNAMRLDQNTYSDAITMGSGNAGIKPLRNTSLGGWVYNTYNGTNYTPFWLAAHPNGFFGMTQCATQASQTADPTGCNYFYQFASNATNLAANAGAGWYAKMQQDNFTGSNIYILPDLAGTSDRFVMTGMTQTLTNKTLDGVSPTTMSYVDPTSSIQTQLNTKSKVNTCGTTTTCSNTAQASPRIVWGTVTLSGGTATVSSMTAFTATTSFGCTATDSTSAAAVKVAIASTSSITVTGTGTDVVTYQCIGN